jgi:hypothetical protein
MIVRPSKPDWKVGLLSGTANCRALVDRSVINEGRIATDPPGMVPAPRLMLDAR